MSCSPGEIYDVVSDVRRYREFVPYVLDSFVNEVDAQGHPTEAGLRVGWKLFDERFVCSLKCVPNQEVTAKSMSHSLFDELSTLWTFAPKKSLIASQGELCIVELALKYRFKSKIYQSVSAAFSQQVTSLMVAAFEARVKQMNMKRVKSAVKREA